MTMDKKNECNNQWAGTNISLTSQTNVKEKDILSYSTVTKNNIKRPYFIKIKNGLNFVHKKYVGESMTDDAKITLISEEGAIDILGEEILNV